jgi:hypothetical protein
MTISTADIQSLYIAYFNRPADPVGLQFYQTSPNLTVASIGAAFAASPEYTSIYAGKQPAEIVSIIYQNLFGRAPEPTGLLFWADALNKGYVTAGNIAFQILQGAQNDDKIAIQSKVTAATTFTTSLDTSAEIVGYSGVAANAVASAWLKGITNPTNLAAATTADALLAVSTAATAAHDGATNVGQTFSLTANVDTIVGTAGNDVINGGTILGTVNTSALSGLDTIDGGAGVDTLNLTVGKVTNVEKLNITSVSTIVGNAAASSINLKTFATGVTEAAIDVVQGAALTVTAATTTSLNVTNDSDIIVVGGGNSATVSTAGAVTIGKAAGFAAADINKFTSVTVTGAAVTAVTDNSGAAGAIGSTLTSVKLDGLTAAATLTGKGINTLTVVGSDQNVTVANTAAHTLTLNTDGVATTAVISDVKASAVTINATGDDSQFALAATAAKTITVTGDATVTLDETGSDYTALTTVSYSGSGTLVADLDTAAALTTITATGAGSLDVVIAGTNGASVAQSVTGGSGDDIVTITGSLGKGSTLSLGAGSDVVKVSGAGVITSEAVVDAGDGVDTLALAIVGGANVGAFKNFENFDVAGITTNFDQAVLNTKNTVTNFVGTGALGGAATLQNLGANVGFIVEGDMGATALTLTQATAGTLTITSDVDEAKADTAANTSAATLVASNATAVNVVFDNNNIDKLATYANAATLNVTVTKAASVAITSGGSEVVNTANITSGVSSGADVLKSLTVTGDQALVLDVVHGGTVSLASVDASGQTAGGLTFSLADLTSTGTIKLGAGDDIITQVAATTVGVTTTNVQSISGLGFGTAAGATAQDGFDIVKFAAQTVAADDATTAPTTFKVKDGVYTFTNAGASTLELAAAAINTNVGAAHAVVFEFAGSVYVLGTGATTAATDDFLVKLAGVSAASVHGLSAVAAGELYVF